VPSEAPSAKPSISPTCHCQIYRLLPSLIEEPDSGAIHLHLPLSCQARLRAQNRVSVQVCHHQIYRVLPSLIEQPTQVPYIFISLSWLCQVRLRAKTKYQSKFITIRSTECFTIEKPNASTKRGSKCKTEYQSKVIAVESTESSASPSNSLTLLPSSSPSFVPSEAPSTKPSIGPSLSLSYQPSASPWRSPTQAQSKAPSAN